MRLKPTTERFRSYLDQFLFESCNPVTCSLIRVGFGLLAIVYVLILMLDGERWFSEQGVLRAETAQLILGGPHVSVFFWATPTTELIRICLWVWLLNCIGLLLGVFSRIQVLFIFVWLVSFQHRNPLIMDGQDTLIRMLAFFMIFLPLDYRWSLSSRLLNRWHVRSSHAPNAWGLRLVQLQMSLIYLSTTVCKLQGVTWRDGTALYYVFQLPAFFGKWPLAEFMLESETLIRFGSWGVLIVEGLVPLALWWRRTRKPALLIAVSLHLVLEYSMHTFLFQWMMIVGFLSFFNPEEWQSWKEALKRAATSILIKAQDTQAAT